MKTHDARIAQLRKLIKRVRPEFSIRKEGAEKHVVRWEYYTNEAYEPRPFCAERFGLKPGRLIRKATSRSYAYGFDSSGRIVVSRAPAVDDEPARVEFRTYSPRMLM